MSAVTEWEVVMRHGLAVLQAAVSMFGVFVTCSLCRADSTTILITGSPRYVGGLAASTGPRLNVWLPDTGWCLVNDLSDAEVSSASVPSSSTELKAILTHFGAPKIRRRYSADVYSTPITAPLGTIDLSFLEGIYEVFLYDTAQVQHFCDSLDSLPLFDAELPATELSLDDAGAGTGATAFSNPPPPVNDPLWNKQGYLDVVCTSASRLNLPRVWNTTKGDTSVVVVIVDRPINWSLGDLAGRRHVGDASTSHTFHGNAVASIIGAMTNNGYGMAGMLWDVTLGSIGYLSNAERFRKDITEDYVQMVKLGPHITNHSYKWPSNHHHGYGTCDQQNKAAYLKAPHRVLVEAYNNGVVHFAAAGNCNADPIQCPASLDECVIAVGALSQSGLPLSGSNSGSWIDFRAQGENLVAANVGGASPFTERFGATSGACPLVAGLGALAYSYGLSVGDTFDADDIRGILKLGMKPPPTRLPQLDSALNLMQYPNSFARYRTSGGWTHTYHHRWRLMNGIKGTTYDYYQCIEHKLIKYVPYPDDFDTVYGVWANGPRSNGAMPVEAVGVQPVISPAKWAAVTWHDAAGCSVVTYYYTDIRTRPFSLLPSQLIGDYPFNSPNDATVTLTVVGQRRLPQVSTQAYVRTTTKAIIVSASRPEIAQTLVIDRQVSAGAWEANFANLTDVDSLILTEYEGSQTYKFRTHAETYNQIGLFGSDVTVVSPPNIPRNLQATVIMRRYDEYTPTAVGASVDSESKAAGNSPLSDEMAADAGGGGGGPIWRATNAVRLTFDSPANQAVPPASYIIRAWPQGVYCSGSPLDPCPPTPEGATLTNAPIRAYEWYEVSEAGVHDICLGRLNWQYEVGVYARGFDGQLSLITPLAWLSTGPDFYHDCQGGYIPEPSVVNHSIGSATFALLQNYPNPFNASTSI